ncbi:hypothetical protein VUJ46_08700 [Chryseobacterium sp. MYb264]|uniref:hypothetical protein n=1 Tax=Chryseobacterium sp. MYb264 TaxID=2745153 RepID=UPI002E1274AB|nr:hypothetical protein VUJ46_08700 [Chryseobacterium sp. MYb264]
MKRKLFARYFLFTGFLMIIVALLMLIFGVSMFTSIGNFSKFIIQLSELCFIFWLPALTLGVICCILGVALKVSQSNSDKN